LSRALLSSQREAVLAHRVHASRTSLASVLDLLSVRQQLEGVRDPLGSPRGHAQGALRRRQLCGCGHALWRAPSRACPPHFRDSVRCWVNGYSEVGLEKRRHPSREPACVRPRSTEKESGAGGLTREVDTPSPSNSPHTHMLFRVERWVNTGGGNALAFKQPT
jgi:hypothetical protein